MKSLDVSHQCPTCGALVGDFCHAVFGYQMFSDFTHSTRPRA